MAINIGHLEATLGINTLGLARGMARAQATLRKAGASMRRIGRNMTMRLSLPLIAIGGGAIKMAADFEKSMSKIEGLVGIAGDKVAAFRSDIMKLSGETAKAPLELADAMFFITSAGLRGADALAVLEISAKGAAAGLGETKVVADLVTSAVNAYGIANLSASKATDILTAAVREGKAEAPELAASMGQVLPIASALEVSFDQIGAAVASMTRTGTNAATASIQLRQILASLLKPSGQAEEAMAKMGTSSRLLRKQLREEGLISVLGFLAEQMKTNEQAMAQVFPNIRALSGALDIMGGNAEENIKIFKRMTDVTGTTEKAFAVAAKTASFQFNQALAELKVEAIALGVSLMPVFKGIINAVRNGVRWFKNLSDTGKKMGLVLAGAAILAGPLISVLGIIASLIGAITLPILGVIVAVAALTAAFVFVSENWEAISERISDWGWWKNVIIDMTAFLIRNNPPAWLWRGFQLVIPLIKEGWTKLTAFLTDISWWKNLLSRMGLWFATHNPYSLMQDAIAFITGTAVPTISEAWTKNMEAVEDTTKDFDWGALWTDPFETIADNLEAMKDTTVEAKKEFGSFTEAMINGANKAKAAIAGIFPSGGGAGGGGVIPSSKVLSAEQRTDNLENLIGKGFQPAEIGRRISEITGVILKDYSIFIKRIKELQRKDTSQWSGWLLRLSEIWTNVNGTARLSFQDLASVLEEGLNFTASLGRLITNVFVSLGQSIGNALAGVDDQFSTPLQRILLIVANFAQQMGAMLISIGSFMLATGIFSGAGAGLVAAGIGLVALGAAGAGIINKKINATRDAFNESQKMQGLRSGGFVTEGGAFQLHKDEVVSLPAGAAVTSQKASRAGGDAIEIFGRLEGEVIYLSNKEYERRLGNTR